MGNHAQFFGLWLLALGWATPHVGAQHAAPLHSAQAPPPHAQQASPRVDVVPNDAERRVDLTVDGKPFTSYIYPTTLKKPALYPLRAASGAIVTRGFPLDPRPGERVDHPHQVGLWFNYGDVNGLDFWNNSDAIPAARAPKMGTILHRAVRRAQSGTGEGMLDVAAEWVDHQGKPLLREDTRFVFRGADGLRGIDRITTLTALSEPVTFTDNKEGLLGMRVARALEHPSTTPEVFTDASGHASAVPVLNNDGVTGRYKSSEGLEGDAAWGTRGRWTMLSGVVEGQPVTIAILDHPKNVGFPATWHARGYGLFAANNLGRKAFRSAEEPFVFRLAPGESTTFRHRVLILSGAATSEQIEAHYRDFQGVGTSSPSPEGRGGQGVRTPEGRGGQGMRTVSSPEPPNQLSAAERAAGWRLLFDGRTLTGWRGLGRDTVPTAHWVVADGAIKKVPSGIIAHRSGGLPPVAGGDLMTEATFADFELTWEWKVTPGANSGVKYNVSEELSTSLARHAALGFEYQVLDDDRHDDAQFPNHRAGALYDLIVPNERKHLRPVGEWNRSTLIFRGNHGEHWLNGEKIVEYDLGTARMDSLLAASKYRSISGFGNRRKGHIVLQDHGDEVYFRNIKIRELAGTSR